MATKGKPRKPKAKKPKKEKKVKQKQKQKQSQNVRQVVNIYKPTRRRYVKRKPAPIQPSPITNTSLNTAGFINQPIYFRHVRSAG